MKYFSDGVFEGKIQRIREDFGVKFVCELFNRGGQCRSRQSPIAVDRSRELFYLSTVIPCSTMLTEIESD